LKYTTPVYLTVNHYHGVKMPSSVTNVKNAEYHHTRVIFNSFGARPGDSLVLTADPWSYLRAHLLEKHRKARGENKERLKRAIYFARLAEDFFKTVEPTPLPGKATLAYYSVLNLAKCYICMKGKLLGDAIEHHGLSPSHEADSDIRVMERGKKHINIFHEFVTSLGSPAPTKVDLSFKECIAHVPEIHEIASRLKLLPDNKRQLLPIDIDILTDLNSSWLLSEIKYLKKQDNRLRTNQFLSGARKRYFREPDEIDGYVKFRCKRRKAFNWRNFERIYSNICKEFQSFDIVTLLSKDGYRCYCDLNDPSYHHLAYALMMLFHLGTIARYNPTQNEKLLEGEMRPVISEALALTPRQFLYQITSRITESICVVPFAKL
jgi:hypothetical protein